MEKHQLSNISYIFSNPRPYTPPVPVLSKAAADWNHQAGRLKGAELMNTLITQTDIAMHYGETEVARKKFEMLITEEDKRWNSEIGDYHYRSIRGRWSEFKVVWAMAKDLI